MKRRIVLAIIITTTLLATLPLAAQAPGASASLGISIGAALPQGSTTRILSTDWQTSFNWGFYVNLPLVYTFHLTPSAELYTLQGQNATDIDIAFKFIVPFSTFSLYAGVVPGLTAVTDVTAPHVGALVGGTFRLVSNLDVFVQAKYNVLFDGSQNIRIFHANAGILFTF